MSSPSDTTFTYADGTSSTSSDTTLTRFSYYNYKKSILVGVDFGQNVTSLGDFCFTDCTSLTSITIPSSVTNIGHFCFQSCFNLTSITIPSSVTSLGYTCFNNCTSLTSVIFDDQSKLINIGMDTFRDCPTMNVTYYLTADYNALSNTSKSLQTQFPSASQFSYFSGASCFNKGTKILCLNKNLEEEYIPIENLRKGDLVKSYKHGYRKIELIGKNLMINNPDKWYECMYKMEKTETNGLTEDLIITGWHSILVDDLKEYKEENDKIFGETLEIDDKYLLLSSVSTDFIKLENTNVYTYYHFILENNGNDDERFGVWANGILTETSSKNLFISAINKGNYNIDY